MEVLEKKGSELYRDFESEFRNQIIQRCYIKKRDFYLKELGDDIYGMVWFSSFRKYPRGVEIAMYVGVTCNKAEKLLHNLLHIERPFRENPSLICGLCDLVEGHYPDYAQTVLNDEDVHKAVLFMTDCIDSIVEPFFSNIRNFDNYFAAVKYGQFALKRHWEYLVPVLYYLKGDTEGGKLFIKKRIEKSFGEAYSDNHGKIFLTEYNKLLH